MQKSNGLRIGLYALLLIVFNVLFFVIGGADHSASAWISYVFIHLAGIAVALTPVLTRGGEDRMVFGTSLFAVSLAYFLLELGLGTLFILIGVLPFAVAFVVQFLLFGIYLAVLISVLMANEHTGNLADRRHMQQLGLKSAMSRVAALMDQSVDENIRRELQRVYDMPSASPLDVPGAETGNERIHGQIRDLEHAVTQNDVDRILSLCRDLQNSIRMRNRV